MGHLFTSFVAMRQQSGAALGRIAVMNVSRNPSIKRIGLEDLALDFPDQLFTLGKLCRGALVEL
jgi:hypothetical protein